MVNKFENFKIVVWNNGPNLFSLTDRTELKRFSDQVSLVETIENRSLSDIYNKFVEMNDSDCYIILDDDTNITNDYLCAINDIHSQGVYLPLVTSKSELISPRYGNKPITNIADFTYINKEIMAIGSGLAFTCDVADQIKLRYGDVFDRRFFLYGVDSTFMCRVNKLGCMISLLPGFDHDLSVNIDESYKVTQFRVKENSYALGLKIRYYFNYRFLLSLLSLLYHEFFKLTRGVKYRPRSRHQAVLKYVLKAIITGEHYRND